MLYRYEIKSNSKEEILYLYLDLKSEFSKELTSNSKDNDLARRTKNFIANNNIKFNGNKVFLIIDGIVVKTLDISTVNEDLKNNPSYSNQNYIVNVKIDDDSIIEVNLFDYLMGTLITNINDSIDMEVIKCLVVLYRTYAYKMMNENKVIINNSDFYKYYDIILQKNVLKDNYDNNYKRLENAIIDTDCIYITYDGDYILPFSHICNNGTTINRRGYPYLKKVYSLWDICCLNSKEVTDYKYDDLAKLLNISIDNKSKIKITEVDDNNIIMKLSIDDNVFSAEQFRNLLNIKSIYFNLIMYQNYLRIISFGYGNHLGLSIFGANELAKDGVNYTKILTYYYPSIKINRYIKELPN